MDTKQYQASLTLSSEEAQAVFRALIDYRRALSLSMLAETEAGASIVHREIMAVDAVSERLSLGFYYRDDLAAVEG